MVIRRAYVLSILFFVVLLAYSPFNEYIRELISIDNTVTNYLLGVIGIAFIVLFKKVPINKAANLIIFVLFCIYLINYIFAPYRNPSWFLYQIVFLLAALYVASIYSKIAPKDFEVFGRNIGKIITIDLLFISCLSIWLLVHYHEVLVGAFRGGDFNSYIYQLREHFYWKKQPMNAFSAIILCYILTLNNKRIRNIFLILPVFFVIIGMRSLWLGFALSILLTKIRSKKILLCLLMILLISMIMFWGMFFEILKLDVRANSYANMVYIICKYPFGVGNGIYHTFVRDYQTVDFSHLTGWNYMPDSPESDIVYIFGSFGLLFGFIFYLVLIWLLLKIWRKYPHLSRVDRFFSLTFMYFLFAGIGEDWMFCFPYWVIFGFALSIATSKRIVSNEIESKDTLTYEFKSV